MQGLQARERNGSRDRKKRERRVNPAAPGRREQQQLQQQRRPLVVVEKDDGGGETVKMLMVVGLCGASGGGKSTLAKNLYDHFPAPLRRYVVEEQTGTTDLTQTDGENGLGRVTRLDDEEEEDKDEIEFEVVKEAVTGDSFFDGSKASPTLDDPRCKNIETPKAINYSKLAAFIALAAESVCNTLGIPLPQHLAEHLPDDKELNSFFKKRNGSSTSQQNNRKQKQKQKKRQERSSKQEKKQNPSQKKKILLGLVIVEGFLLFSNAQVLNMLDAKIFIHCTRNTSYSRRLHRRERSNVAQFTQYYDNYVWPCHVIFNRHIYQLMKEPIQHELLIDDKLKKHLQHELLIDDKLKKHLEADEEEGFFPRIAGESVHFIDGEMSVEEVYHSAVTHLTKSIKDNLRADRLT